MRRQQWVALALLPAALAGRAHAKISTPDAAGYFWADQDETFVDRSVPPSVGPIQVLDVANEQMSSVFDLGFDFPYYGLSYRMFKVSDNGWLTFDTTITNPQPTPSTLPAITAPPLMLAAYWRDLEPFATIDPFYFEPVEGGAYFRYAAQRPGSGALILYHMVLYDTGCFKFWYQFVDAPDTVSVGMQDNGTAGRGKNAIFLGSSPEGFDLRDDAVIQFCPPPKLSCAGAGNLSCGTPFVGTSPATLPTNATTYVCSPNTYLGRERVLTFTNNALSNVSLELSNMLPTLDLDIIVMRENKCSEYECLTWGDTRVDLGLLPAGTYQVVVDGKSDLDNGAFTLTASCEQRGETLPCGSPTVAGTTAVTSAWDTYSCAGSPSLTGGEWAYEVPFTPPGNIRATLTNHPGGDLDLILLDKANLQASACLAYGDETLNFYNPASGTYVVVVDGHNGFSGTYDLTVTCGRQLDCTTPPPLSLTCQKPQLGTTLGRPNLVTDYSCTTGDFPGGEAVFSFNQAAQGTVSFLLDGPSDLSLQIVGAGCNEGACIASGRPLTARDLPAGNYFLVVDGRSALGGDFTITPVCSSGLSPANLEVTLAPGDCVPETKTAILSPNLTEVDVLFAVDVSQGQVATLPKLDAWTSRIITDLQSQGANVAVGLVSFADYVNSRDSCGTQAYGVAGDYPYRLDLAITTNLAQLTTRLGALAAVSGGDLAESYTRAWYETYADSMVGWRPNARRVVIMTGDDVPHDCLVSACLGGTSDPWGVDPGRNGTPNNADDLEIVPVMTETGNQNILPLFIYAANGLPPRTDGLNGATIRLLWSCWTGLSGGQMIDAFGSLLTDADHEQIQSAIAGSTSSCEDLHLEASAGFGAWLQNVTPPSRSNVTAPGTTSFDIQICAPGGTPSGVSNFTVDLVCDGRVVAQQTVAATVSSCGFFPMTSISGRRCPGDTQTLSGAGSTIPGCTSAIEYRWLDFFRSPLTGWSAANEQYAVPVNFDFAYIMQLRCQNQGQCLGFGEALIPVTVTRPVADAGPDLSTCQNQGVLLGLNCDANNTYSWNPTTDLDNPALCQPTVTPLTIPSPDPWIDYTVTVTNPQGCVATDVVRVTVGTSGAAGSVGNHLFAVRAGNDVSLDWTTGATIARRYNLHRTTLKTELDKSAMPYAAPVLTPLDAIETYAETVITTPQNYFYEAFGRACDGTSVIQ